MTKSNPTCYVIAGPNGAGKTTFALWYLPRVAGCVEFVNADFIARGLSPLNEASAQIQAGRLFLERIHILRRKGISFAMETTLSGLGHAGLLRNLREDGYRIELNYLWIPSADFSAQRVASRVANGGHDIPAEAIARRYAKSLRNLLARYLSLADYAAVWDNSAELPRRVYEQTGSIGVVFDAAVWRQMEEHRS